MKDSASPRQGWDYHEYLQYATAAKSDAHGALFFYVRDLLVKFCERVKKTNLSFDLYCQDARFVVKRLQHLTFDRIEVTLLIIFIWQQRLTRTF